MNSYSIFEEVGTYKPDPNEKELPRPESLERKVIVNNPELTITVINTKRKEKR